MRLLAVLFLTLLSFNTFAQTPTAIKELSKKITMMPPVKDCDRQGICDLKSVKTVEIKEKVLLEDEHPDHATYMTDFRFVLEVNKPSQIENYGVVQFLRGCMFESELQPDGTIKNRFAYVHKHFGKYQLLRHDNWVVDSDHDDPLTTAFEGYGRFDLFKWNKNPKDLEADNANWYFDSPPPHGTVFKSELISNTGLIEDTQLPAARNSTIELKSCLFKIGDLPKTTTSDGAGIDMSKAIWCSDWGHKFVYNYQSKMVEETTQIHPFCAEPSNWPF